MVMKMPHNYCSIGIGCYQSELSGTQEKTPKDFSNAQISVLLILVILAHSYIISATF